MKDSGDFISRDAFKQEVIKLSTHYLNEWDTLGVLAVADKIPAADVRPMVLCSDCKHATTWYRDRLLCFLWNEEGNSVFEDGYCSYGERRANDV